MTPSLQFAALPDKPAFPSDGVSGDEAPHQKTVNSETFVIQTPTGKRLSLRQWWPLAGQKPVATGQETPILVIPGYGGRTGWGAPLAEKLLAQHPFVYGLNLASLEADLSKRTPMKSPESLLGDIRETMDWMQKTHGGKVRIVANSLGALAATLVAAERSRDIEQLVLIAPAYRPADGFIRPGFYLKSLGRKILEALHLVKPKSLTLAGPEEVQNSEKKEKHKKEKFVLSFSMMLSILRMSYLRAFGSLRKIKVPTMMVVPGKDKMCSPDAMRKGYELLPVTDKKLVEHPEARHMLVMDEDIHPLAETISQWFQSH